MQKSPFKLYDFLGYTFPGAFVLLGFMISWVLYADFEKSITLRRIVETAVAIFQEADWCRLAIFIFFAYIIGHIVSYISSMTVEKLSIMLYGYPSEFLLQDTDYRPNMYLTTQAKKDVLAIIVVFVGLFPIVICEVIIGYLCKFRKYIIKPVDKNLQTAINDKIVILINDLNLQRMFKNGEAESDFNRIAHHYVYSKGHNVTTKLDNYVALYGFNRAFCLIFNICFICEGILMLLGIVEFNWLLLLATLLLSFIFFMAFMKFYRRYTLENFMDLIVESSLCPRASIHYNIQYESSDTNQ